MDVTCEQEQHGITLVSSAQFYVIKEPFYGFLQDYVVTGHPTFCSCDETSCSGHEAPHIDSYSSQADLWYHIAPEVLIQHLMRDAFAELPSFADPPSFATSWMIPDADFYSFLQRYALSSSELLIPAESLAQFLEGHEIPESLSTEIGNETSGDQGRTTPSQPPDSDQANAQLNESSPHACPICQKLFPRVQERNRHVAESYLPHPILCPLRDCTWTGRRQWDFKVHCKGKHPEAAPKEDAKEIYDPKEFVKSILDGTPVEEVARSAFAKAEEGLERLGRPDVGTNVLGRNKDLRKWVLTSSQSN